MADGTNRMSCKKRAKSLHAVRKDEHIVRLGVAVLRGVSAVHQKPAHSAGGSHISSNDVKGLHPPQHIESLARCRRRKPGI